MIPALKLKLDRDALLKLERKMRSVPPEWFEHTEFLDFVEKAHKGTEYCFALMVPMLRFLFDYGPYCVLMGVYLWQFDPVLVLCVVLIQASGTEQNLFYSDRVWGSNGTAGYFPAERTDFGSFVCVRFIFLYPVICPV